MVPLIELTDQPNPPRFDALVASLTGHNEPFAGPAGYRPLLLSLLHPDTEAFLGGLSGSTLYRWLLVDILFVPDALRGQGIGRTLMGRAEAEALARGSIAARLTTFSFQARAFYEGLGYRIYAELPGYPPGHSALAMSKALEV